MANSSELSRDVSSVAKIAAVPIILNMVKHVTGMRFAAIARVTSQHWVACAVDDSINFGIQPGGELVLESTICNEIRQHRQPVLFTHAREHPIYSKHHTPKTYQLESYVSIPIVRSNGEFFGTLCAIDSMPAEFDEAVVRETLGLFAQLIAMNLDLQESLENSENALVEASEAGRLREQFIAVLGHDLRTPLSAVRMSAELLAARVTDQRGIGLIQAIRQSSLRMGNLIEDVLDFARGKLGGGLAIKSRLVDDLHTQLSLVIEETKLSYPQSCVTAHLDIPQGLYCDPVRLGQLLSNLLNNAITHGSKGTPVHVQIATDSDQLVLGVTNQGVPISPALMPLLFEPFSRSEAGQRGEGLGLGLYIARQICVAHNGTLEVTSNAEDGIRFVASIPSRMKWL